MLEVSKNTLIPKPLTELKYIGICFPRFSKNILVSVSIGNQNNSIVHSHTAGVYDSRLPLQLLASGCDM